jgi:two-component system C4-dicarboxylate transport response regulator DctD
VLSALGEQQWPGNVRELRNAADRFILDLGLPFLETTPDAADAESSPRLAERVADFERGLIENALIAHGGSLKPVYESLGLSRKSLYEKMQKYGLERARYLSADDADL